jgi:hypothetical protein
VDDDDQGGGATGIVGLGYPEKVSAPHARYQEVAVDLVEGAQSRGEACGTNTRAHGSQSQGAADD